MSSFRKADDCRPGWLAAVVLDLLDVLSKQCQRAHERSPAHLCSVLVSKYVRLCGPRLPPLPHPFNRPTSSAPSSLPLQESCEQLMPPGDWKVRPCLRACVRCCDEVESAPSTTLLRLPSPRHLCYFSARLSSLRPPSSVSVVPLGNQPGRSSVSTEEGRLCFHQVKNSNNDGTTSVGYSKRPAARRLWGSLAVQFSLSVILKGLLFVL